ncbi:ZRANB2-like [Ictidomys tridecemlineatus]|uniref:Zinc finger Ran-binding domain-containing protein 2 n=1 Tax=Ictidomys tridecemlineatus TaxID=43179 RepID=I3N5M6_ICTTR|nr:ZRANB2-like [Ictidomys tridecemlineatus]
MSTKNFQVNDGDWICPDKKCGNVNFARRTSYNRCGREKTTEAKMMKARGTEIEKTLAEKSRGLFSANEWQCKTCSNVNWARRSDCNMCNIPKYAILEERTEYGDGFNERENVEYIEREESGGEYDEFGFKKKKYRGKAVGPASILKEDEDLSKYKLDEVEDEDDADLSKYNLDASEEEDSNKKKSNRRSRSKSRSSHSQSSSLSLSPSSSRSRSRSHSRSSSSLQSRSHSSSRERSRPGGSKSRSSSRSHRSPRKRPYSSSSSSERNRKRSRSRSSSPGDRKKRWTRSRPPER